MKTDSSLIMKLKLTLLACGLAGGLAQPAAAIDPIISPEFGVGGYSGIGNGLPAYQPRIASDGNIYLVVWADAWNLSEYVIYGARVRPDGTVLDPYGIVISRSSSPLLRPSVAGNANGFFVAWAESRGNSTGISGTFIASDGQPASINGMAITSGANPHAFPAVAANSTEFLVVWQYTADTAVLPGQRPNTQIQGARITGEGVLRDLIPLEISSRQGNAETPAVAASGPDYMVVWADYAQQQTTGADINGASVSSSGGVGAVVPISTELVLKGGMVRVMPASGDQQLPAITGNSTGFLVVWDDTRHTAPLVLHDVYGTRVRRDGLVLDVNSVRITSDNRPSSATPATAASECGYLAVWETQSTGGNTQNIQGKRLSNDGVFLDSSALGIDNANGDQTFAAVAYGGGGQFLTVCESGLSGTHRVGATLVSDQPCPPSFVVTTTADDGPGSLRVVINLANANPGRDTITFAIPGVGPHIIQPASPLPIITEPVIIDGFTQPGAVQNSLALGDNARLQIQVDGRLMTSGRDGLIIAGGDSTIRGLAVGGFTNDGAAAGVLLVSSNNIVEGCFLGTDVTGLTALPNVHGVLLTNAFNRIGGPGPGSRNVISGNRYSGVYVWQQASTGNRIQGNYIGPDATGTNRLGNGTPLGNGAGIGLSYSGSNLIGGSNPGEGNVISGNFQSNLSIVGDTNTVQGNFIGPDAAGTHALGSGYYGLILHTSALGNIIGGTNAREGNLISGNPRGINVSGGATGTLIVGNKIGTDLTGRFPLGNSVDGIACEPGSSDSLIGGTDPAAANVIAFNGRRGVCVYGASAANRILGNSIFENARLGIDLTLAGFGNEETDGPTPNDFLDADSGPNQLQNFPVLTSGSSSGGLTLGGYLNSTPLRSFRLEFFANSKLDPSGYGEGERFIGSTTVTTDGQGKANFIVSLPQQPVSLFYTATATDLQENNTSEFSLGAPVLRLSLTSSNTLVVSWPSASAGFSLRQTTDLTSGVWTTPAEPVNDNGAEKFIVVSPTAGARFYRLVQP